MAKYEMLLFFLIVHITEVVSQFCPTLPQPANGRVNQDEEPASVNSRARYTCDSGLYYVAGGTNVNKCLGSFTWSHDLSCELRECLELTPPAGTILSSNDTLLYSVVTAHCDDGYEYASGDFILYCEYTWVDEVVSPKAGIWNGTVLACSDEDECAAVPSVCTYPGTTCLNTGGGFTCLCMAGYAWDGSTCIDVDECADGSHACNPLSTCSNTDGDYICICIAGYTGSSNTCNDIDECADVPAVCNDLYASCVNTDGSFNCVCTAGLTWDGAACIDVDECADVPPVCNHPDATCVNTDGSFDCICIAGFTWDGTACIDIDECADVPPVCNQPDASCVNTDGSFNCVCLAGQTWDGTACIVVDPCVAVPPVCDDPDATCVNTNGTYDCICIAGLTWNGTACTDLDECVDNSHTCHVKATCVNTAGSYTCTCSEAYTGDGTTCTDVDECAAGSPLCDENANCLNFIGSYICRCNVGYTGDGLTCTANTGVDECVGDPPVCDPHATCTDTDDSYTCTCNPGYIGDGSTCTVIYCPKHCPVKYGVVTGEDHSFGSVVNISCNLAYFLDTGDQSRTCLATMEWSGTKPVCKARPLHLALIFLVESTVSFAIAIAAIIIVCVKIRHDRRKYKPTEA